MSTYTTIQGDMWDSIAYKVYGDRSYTGKLMRLNPKYHDYFIFPAGIELTMPEPTITLNTLLPPWKQVSSNGD